MLKTHTFFLKIWSWNEAKMEVYESDTVSLRESWYGEDNEQSQKFEGKTEKV